MEEFLSILNVELLISAIRLSTPITLAAIGATICERSGIVNIAMEGIMIIGAFFGAMAALASGSPWVGLVAGVAAGGLFSMIHAVATISLHLDHVVSGAVLNILAMGVSRYLLVLFIGHPGTTDSMPVTLSSFQFAIPGFSKIPVIGPILFDQTPIVYMSFVLIFVLWFLLFKTKVGLHIRSAGEHPLALETIGVSVYKIRYLAVGISGLLSGLGGAYLAVEHTGAFTEGMTNGRGFIALAAMISGGWNPIGAFIASFFFGFAEAFQIRMQPLSIINLPREIFIIFPYLAAVIAVAGFVRKSRAPKAVGTDFIIEKEDE